MAKDDKRSSATNEHRTKAREKGPVSLFVVTVSDSRTPENDENGKYLGAAIRNAGHTLTGLRIVPDEPAEIESMLEVAETLEAQIVIFNGGTGVSKRDNTYDVLASKLEKTLNGFGEIFRMLSWNEVGAAAMLSRATAGTYKGMILIATPGSPNAVKLAWEKLIEPEIAHLAWEVGR